MTIVNLNKLHYLTQLIHNKIIDYERASITSHARGWLAELKKEGAIVSPVRCKWEPA